MNKINNINQDFVVVNADKKASIEHSDSELYQRLAQNYGNFTGCELISCHSFTNNWPSWETHPNGDEIVILLAGAARFILMINGQQQELELSEPGSYVIVPQGVWHTAKIKDYAQLLFITPGEGTEHKAL